MELEFRQLELHYAKLRRRNARKERQLLASLAERGQQTPVVVVHGSQGGTHVLVDGYKRVRALASLRQDTVQATLWDLAEPEAVVLERLMRTGESDGALEQGWLLQELNERFALSHEELARRFDKSQSWVSRRLALVRDLPAELQQRVQSGALGAHAAMRFLVPMARAKRADCLRLVEALGQSHPSTRELATLYAAWAHGDPQTRELVVTRPAVVLRARAQALNETPLAKDKDAAGKLCDDFGILIGVSRRARQQCLRGALGQMAPPEQQQARRTLQQARWECEALFRTATASLGRPPTSAPEQSIAPDLCGRAASTESLDAR
jgi:ParB family transcriptional regulator, chromosome partitioning protein